MITAAYDESKVKSSNIIVAGTLFFFSELITPLFFKTMNFFTSIIGLAEVLLFLSIQTRPVMSQGNRTLQQTGFKPRLTNFKLDVHRLLEGARIRKKRHIREDEDLKNIEPPTHNMRVGKLSQEHALSYLSDYNLTLWISFEYQSKIQVLVGTQEGHLILFELSDSDDKDGRIVSISLQEDIASKAMEKLHPLNEALFLMFWW
ncbi:uncharacterized protein NPIL_651471 [Nephila pilipes]|uniref:Uncharacterized protein n=1 Tax=Nephila pilipes TaxID=299642 RepID=A0A8X6IPV3_NEPPI|nr:uncharacterized protein NPIL_651471 [Nephila pilipes]